MTELRRELPGPRDDADVAQVVGLLRLSGPRALRELARDPAIREWSAKRVEQAVVTAWSRNLIFIDSGDHLVAL